VVAGVLVVAVPTTASAAPAYLLTSSSASDPGAIVPFDTDNPRTANFGASIPIANTDGERILGIDSRPATRLLYGMSEDSRLYTINPATGVATQVGTPGGASLDPFVGVFQGIGADFDPVADLFRITEDDGLVNGQDDNFTVNPNTGFITQHSDLGGAATDVDIAGVAYTNNFAGATSTTVYAVETNQPVMGNSRLVVIDPPNAGTLTNVDSNGNGLGRVVDSQNIGFDIFSDASPNRAFATLSVGGVFGLYRIDLRSPDGGTGTGDAFLVGNFNVPGGTAVRGFAVPFPPLPPPPPPPAAAVPDRIAPALSRVSLSRKRFRVGARPTRLSARRRPRAKAGTTIRYRLSENAAVSFRIERTLAGRSRRVRGRRRCVKPTRALVRARARRCKRYRRAGTLSRQGRAGANRLAFSGRVGRRALRRGRYRLTLQATDAAGNRSRASRRNFTIVRR
jgi:Domain of unknown function (DUF4394)